MDGENLLTSLNNNLMNCESLTDLHFNHNELKSLPDSFNSFKSLEHL